MNHGDHYELIILQVLNIIEKLADSEFDPYKYCYVMMNNYSNLMCITFSVHCKVLRMIKNFNVLFICCLKINLKES